MKFSLGIIVGAIAAAFGIGYYIVKAMLEHEAAQ